MYKVRDCKIITNEKITSDLFLMKIKGEFEVKEGQFFMIKANESFMTLYRPISVFDADDKGISFLYSVRGRGTDFFSRMKAEEVISVHGPYGNGFPKAEGSLALVGGGIGMAPLYLTAKRNKDAIIYIGLREDLYLDEEIDNIKKLFEGVNTYFKIGGFVTEGIEFDKFDMVFTCGPEVMMEAVSKLHDNCYISLEKHMGCGVGACLSCTCEALEKRVKVCQDGPVFRSKEVFFDEANYMGC